jgi:hypothetical protein
VKVLALRCEKALETGSFAASGTRDEVLVKSVRVDGKRRGSHLQRRDVSSIKKWSREN